MYEYLDDNAIECAKIEERKRKVRRAFAEIFSLEYEKIPTTQKRDDLKNY